MLHLLANETGIEGLSGERALCAGGSTGWQAPEQLILRSGGEARQGRSVDIFTFGLLIFYCLSGGQHPFGEGIERDYRILNVRF